MRIPDELLPVVEWWEKDGKQTLAIVCAVAVIAAGWYGVKGWREARAAAAGDALLNAESVEELEAAVASYGSSKTGPALKLRLAKAYFDARNFQSAADTYAELQGKAPAGFDDVPYLGAAECLEGGLESGRARLGQVGDALPAAALFHDPSRGIHQEAPAFAQALKERQYLRVMWEPVGEGRHGLLCTVQENETPTLLLRLNTCDRSLADRIAATFRERASRLLLMLYTRGLMLNVEQADTLNHPAPSLPQLATAEDALAAATPEQAYLSAYSLREQLAAVCLGKEPQLRLGLLLPGQTEAFHWAHAALNDPDLLYDVLDLLTREDEP